MNKSINENLLDRSLGELRGKKGQNSRKNDEMCETELSYEEMTTQATDMSDNYHRYRDVQEKPKGAFGGLSSMHPLVMISAVGMLVIVSSAVTSCWVFMKNTPMNPHPPLRGPSAPTPGSTNSSREWQSLYFSELAEEAGLGEGLHASQEQARVA